MSFNSILGVSIILLIIGVGIRRGFTARKRESYRQSLHEEYEEEIREHQLQAGNRIFNEIFNHIEDHSEILVEEKPEGSEYYEILVTVADKQLVLAFINICASLSIAWVTWGTAPRPEKEPYVNPPTYTLDEDGIETLIGDVCARITLYLQVTKESQAAT
jgi:hypothetical protein